MISCRTLNKSNIKVIRHLPFSMIILFSILIFSSLGILKRPGLNEIKTLANSIDFADEAMKRVISCHYASLSPQNFRQEQIDIDKNGKSILESQDTLILDNYPCEDLKTVKIQISWPLLDKNLLSPDKAPAFRRYDIAMMINKPDTF